MDVRESDARQDVSPERPLSILGARAVVRPSDRGALSFGSFLWASKEKIAPAAAEISNKEK